VKAKGFRQQYGPNLSHSSTWIRCHFFSENVNNQNLQRIYSTCHIYSKCHIHTMRSPWKKISICISFRFQFSGKKYALFWGKNSIRSCRTESSCSYWVQVYFKNYL